MFTINIRIDTQKGIKGIVVGIETENGMIEGVIEIEGRMGGTEGTGGTLMIVEVVTIS